MSSLSPIKANSSNTSSLVQISGDDKSSRDLIRNYPFTYDESKYSIVRIEEKKSIADTSILPTGKDHGKGPANLMNNYVNHVLISKQQPKLLHPIANKEFFSNTFNEGDFDFKLSSVELQSVPLQSQIFRQRSIFPSNSKDQKKFFIILTEKLKRNDPSIVRLRLSGMNINDFVLSQVCSGLIRNSWVQIILLHNNKITDKGAAVLSQALQYHPHCHSIWLASNRITDAGMRHIAELLHWNHHIKELNISNRWPSEIWAKKEYEMHPHITYAGAEFLARYLSKGAGLTSLSLADQRLRDDGATILFSLLPNYPLRSLNLSGNMLGDRCCKTLKNILPQNPILEELILSKNKISSAGAIDIACGLSYNQLLTLLDLAHNEIADAGLYALYKCLQYNVTIRSLITLGNIRNSKMSLLTNGTNSNMKHKSIRMKNNTPFSPMGDVNGEDWENINEDDDDVDEASRDTFHADSHGQYELHAEALAAHRNRNSMVAHHPGNPMEGETPNKHASFAVLSAIREEASHQELSLAQSDNIDTLKHSVASSSILQSVPPNMRELRASLSIPRLFAEESNDNSSDLQITVVSPNLSETNGSAERSTSPKRQKVLTVSTSAGLSSSNFPPFDQQNNTKSTKDMQDQPIMHYRAPRESFDAMIASPFTRRSVLVQQEQQLNQQRRNSIRKSISAGQLSSPVMPTTPLFAVPGVSAHGKKGLTRSITTTSSLFSPAGKQTASFATNVDNRSPFSGANQNSLPGNNNRQTANTTFGMVSIEEAIAQAIKNVEDAPSPKQNEHKVHNGDRHKRNTHNEETDNNHNDDDISLQSAASGQFSLASVEDLVPFRREKDAARMKQYDSNLAASSGDDRSIGADGRNYRRKGRSMSINPFTLTPHEMKDYFDGKIIYNPYRDEKKKKRDDAERRAKSEKQARDREEELYRRGRNTFQDDNQLSRPSSSSSVGSASSSISLGNQLVETSQTKPRRRLSQDLGKTLGVPHFQSIGIKPIRSSISDYADSGQHLMYLRVVTEDDPVDARPTSLVKIGLDRERERNNLKKQRQTTEYKAIKVGLLQGNPNSKVTHSSHGKVHTVPDTFWQNWDLRLRGQYPKGIDRAPGCISTKVETIHIPPPPHDVLEVDPYAKYDREHPQSAWNRYLEYMRRPELKYQRHLHFNENQFTPGQVLAARRKEQLENRILRDASGETIEQTLQVEKDKAELDTIENADKEEALMESLENGHANSSVASVVTSDHSHHANHPPGHTLSKKKPHVSRVKLPAVVAAKIHQHTYPDGHLAALQAAHSAVDGPPQTGNKKKRSSVVDISRLRRTSVSAFVGSGQQHKKI